MSIDYKTYQSKPDSGPKSWHWLLLGSLLGLSLSWVLLQNKHWIPWIKSLKWQEIWHDFTKEKDTIPAALTGAHPEEKSIQHSIPQPKFEFYNVLPEMEVMVAEPKSEVRKEPPPTPSLPHTQIQTGTQPTVSPSKLTVPIFILQVGAFKSEPEAEKLKAELALLSLFAGIETSKMPNGTTWYRVKLGPYDSESKTEQHKRILQTHGIQSFKVKIED